jgi:hypothetical protein
MSSDLMANTVGYHTVRLARYARYKDYKTCLQSKRLVGQVLAARGSDQQ